MSEWILLLPMKRVDRYSEFLMSLTQKLLPMMEKATPQARR